MLFLGGCITTPWFWVLMTPWFGWGLEIFQFSPSTSLWQVGEQSISHIIQYETLRPLQELAFSLGRQLGLRY